MRINSVHEIHYVVPIDHPWFDKGCKLRVLIQDKVKKKTAAFYNLWNHLHKYDQTVNLKHGDPEGYIKYGILQDIRIVDNGDKPHFNPTA